MISRRWLSNVMPLLVLCGYVTCALREYCEFPDPIPHARLRGTKKGDYFVPGEKAEVWCEPGYRCEGNDIVECGEGGIWSEKFGVCKEVFCERPPPVKNGKILEVTDSDRTSFPYGSDIHYVCDKGYRIEGTGDGWRTCVGTGVWSGPDLSCKAIRCQEPDTPENGIRISSLYPVGSRIRFSCNADYELKGAEEILCQANGEWSGEPTKCDLPGVCPPRTFPNSVTSIENNAERRDKIDHLLSEKYDYVWLGRLGARMRKKGKFILIPFNITKVIKEGAEGKSSVENHTRILRIREYCEIGNIVERALYLIMGKDPQNRDAADETLNEYILDTESLIHLWLPVHASPNKQLQEDLEAVTERLRSYDLDNSTPVVPETLTKRVDIKERERRKFRTALVDPDFKGRTNLYFAFDSSGSIPKYNFDKGVGVAKAIVQLVGVSTHGTRVGALTFASESNGIFLPLHYETVEDVLDAFDAIKSKTTMGGRTSASSALRFIREVFIPIVGVAMETETIRSVIFILTDGRADWGSDNHKEVANRLKEEGVDVYCVGVAGDVSTDLLYDVASKDPQTESPRVFLLQNYATVSRLAEEIAFGHADYSQCGLGKENVGVASGRIVGGQRVTEPWPWMAALYMTESKGKPDDKSLECGGSVIHPYFILTAAHCMYYNRSSDLKREPKDITVKLGLVNVTDTEHVQELRVRKIYVHRHFSHRTYDYDAALLELEEPIQYSSRHLPICLPPKDIPADSPFYKPKSKVWTAGWGDVRMRRKFDPSPYKTTDVLKEIRLEIQSPETCRESVADDGRTFTDRMFCAGSGRGLNDTCHGDSGGPVMRRHLDEAGRNVWTQVGIVSWGEGCGLRGEYGMYVRLHRLMPWVEDTVRTAEEWRE